MPGRDQVVTGEAVAVDLRLAGIGSRGVAALIDLVLVSIAQVFLLTVVLAALARTLNGDGLIAVFIISVVGITVGYPVGMETLWRGRTLGKAAMGLRVVRDDGGPIRFRHALVRGLVGVVVDKPGVSQGLLAFVPMLVSSRNKRLGDFAAGTIVLQERVPGHVNAPVAMPAPLAGWAMSLDLSRIDDWLAMRLRQFMGRATNLSPDSRASWEHELATEIVSRVGPAPPGAPDWAVISAILAERRRRAYLDSGRTVDGVVALAATQLPTPVPPAAVAAPEQPTPTASGFAPPG